MSTPQIPIGTTHPSEAMAAPGSVKPAGSVDYPGILIPLRIQIHQLNMTMLYGGPSEICGAIDAVESALQKLRELVTPNDKSSPTAARR